MAKLVSMSTARYWAQQAFRLSLYHGKTMKKAIVQGGIEITIDRDHDDTYGDHYAIGWMQNGCQRYQFVKVAKAWI